MSAAHDLAEAFTTFGPLLRYLRKRAQLTQRDLGIAVGYSVSQISLLEHGQRLPDLTTLAALFIPALNLQDESHLTARLLELAAAARQADEATVQTRITRRAIIAEEIIESTAPFQPLAFNHQPPRAAASLPAPLLPLIGRTSELDHLHALITDPTVRLITVLGPPGVGKTRLALQLAREVQHQFVDGAHWIDLSAIAEHQLVAATLRVSIGLPTPVDPEAAEVQILRDGLRDRQALLLIDNFEQVIDAAPLIAEVLSAAPRAKAIVTSRSALEVYGEHTFTVAPLLLPDSPHLPPLKDLQRYPAIMLFVERARAVQPAFSLTSANASAVAAICAHLDGLPLTIELAAAQSQVFTPQDLLQRLIEHRPLTARGTRHRPARQRTLTDAIAWSYRQLNPIEQRLFCALSVFAGGFTTKALQEFKIVDDPIGTLSALLAKSLIQAQPEVAGELRFSLLETIREFAAERLVEHKAEETARQLHAAYFTTLAERIEPQLMGMDQARWLDRLEKERDNFRTALKWLLHDDRDPVRIGPALRLCVALWKYWRYRCYLNEGYTWTTHALHAAQRAPKEHLALRAQAEWGAGMLIAVSRDEVRAAVHLERSLRLWERTEDTRGIAGALTALGARAMYQGNYGRAIHYQREALKLYESEGELQGLAYAHNALGESLRAAGDYAASRAHYQASLELAQQTDHQRGVAVAISNLAQVEIAEGQLATAREHLITGLALFREIGDAVNVAACVMSLGCLYAAFNTEAEALQAAQLFGLADRVLRESGGTLEAADRREAEKYQAAARAALGDDAFTAAWQTGQTPASEAQLWQLMLGDKR
ncbi:Putative HTH-type transcriptional regulator [Thermoflexales bacterium]|nr:Putative HTH-type transcriptional regulator [Thermoflexales bacterium]